MNGSKYHTNMRYNLKNTKYPNIVICKYNKNRLQRIE